MSSPKSARHYATDWIFRNSQVTGLARYIFVGIAQFMKGDHCETPPTMVVEIRDLTGMGESTIRRSIKELEDAGDLVVVKANRRGTAHRYVLAKNRRLPMDLDPPERSERAVSPSRRSGDSPPAATSVTSQSEQSAPQRSVGPVSASGALVQQASSPDLSTSSTSGTTTSSSELTADMDVFLAWFAREYPRHRNGVMYVVNAADFGAARELLTERTLQRVQGMTLRMWADKSDTWVNGGDRSPRVLRACAALYESQVVEAERRSLTPWELAKRAGLK